MITFLVSICLLVAGYFTAQAEFPVHGFFEKCSLCSMKTADAICMCLPDGLAELFYLFRFERTEASSDIWLDEKKKLSDEDYRNPNIVARGYTDYVKIQD